MIRFLTTKVIIAVLVPVLGLFLIDGVSYAKDPCEDSILQLTKAVHKYTIGNEDSGIVKTTLSTAFTAASEFPLRGAIGMSGDMAGVCTVYNSVTEGGVAEGSAEYNSRKKQWVDLIASRGIPLADATQMVECAMSEGKSNPKGCDMSGEDYKMGAGLSSMANAIDKIINDAPIEAMGSYAMYFNMQLAKIPFLGDRAYAAITPNIFGASEVYNIWVGVRNVAYGFMAVLLVIIGILIMTRKKINPQTVVTVQQAIPKIIISLFLITFSYLIGISFLSFAKNSTNVAISAFSSFVQDTDGPGKIGGAALNITAVSVVALGLAVAAQAGWFSTLAFTLVLLVSLITYIVVGIKYVLLYMKMLFSMVLAPIHFAMGAVPGKEGAITDWFKNNIANALSIPAMWVCIRVAWYLLGVGGRALLSGFSDPASRDVTGFGYHLGSSSGLLFGLLSVFLFLSCMFAAIRVPNTVKAWIVGDPKKPGGKR